MPEGLEAAHDRDASVLQQELQLGHIDTMPAKVGVRAND